MEFIWDLAYHSGMTAKSDLRAAVDEGVPVGVVATLLDLPKVYLTLPRYLDSGGAEAYRLRCLCSLPED